MEILKQREIKSYLTQSSVFCFSTSFVLFVSPLSPHIQLCCFCLTSSFFSVSSLFLLSFFPGFYLSSFFFYLCCYSFILPITVLSFFVPACLPHFSLTPSPTIPPAPHFSLHLALHLPLLLSSGCVLEAVGFDAFINSPSVPLRVPPNGMDGWMDGWLDGWLAGWLVGW